MHSPRHWHGAQLVAAWLLACAIFWVVRWVFGAGTYRARIEGQEVLLVSGFWPAEFASAVTVVTGAISLVTLAWLTATWLAGRKNRERVEAIIESPYRRPLM